MPINKKPTSNKANSKNTNKKPLVKKKSKNEVSPALVIGLVFCILLLCFGTFYIYFKIKNTSQNNQQKTKTHYITARKEPEKLKVKVYTEESAKKEEKAPVKVQPKTKPVETKNTNNTYNSNKSNNSNNNFKKQFPKKDVSQEREWQPINPAIRAATNRYKNLIYGGLPETKFKVTLLENMAYYSAYSEVKRNPLWVAYRLDPFAGKNRLDRLRKFITDPRTKSKIKEGIYAKSGYDKGHLCPNSAIAARYGREGQKETFFMSNISPQKPELNRNVWERLERLEEAYANKFGGIWIITGPIFDQHIELLSRQVEIPDAFYKILIDEDQGKIRVLPFIFPQKVTGKEILNEYLTSVDEIERLTGLDFFTAMDDEYEKKLESYVPAKTLWK